MFISCAILDDEPNAVQILENYVEKVPFLNLIQSFRDPMDFVNFYSEQTVDLVLLDINMPGLSGLGIAKMIKDRSMVIFTTAYNQYALDGFEVNALDFLLKPIPFERFLMAVTKASETKALKESYRQKLAVEKVQGKKDYLFVKSGPAIYKIDPNEILYLEKAGNYFKIHTTEKSYLIRMNFAQIMNQLPMESFVRVHKSYIIHLRFIDKVEVACVYIRNHQIPISINFRIDLLQAIARLS